MRMQDHNFRRSWRVLLGYAVKITRKEKDAVVLISEKAYLEYKDAIFEVNKLKNKDF